MKTIHELSREEILAMDEEFIRIMIDRECAEAGVPLLPKIGDPPVKPEARANQEFFEVSATLLFGRREDAEAVLREIKERRRYDTFYHKGSYAYNSPQGTKEVDETDGSIIVKRYWSRDHYDAHKHDLDAYDDKKSVWDEEKKEYDEIAKKRTDCVDRVRSIVEDAHAQQRKVGLINQTFEEYLSLAQGDEGIAYGFLVKAGRWTQADIEEVIGADRPHLLPPTEEPADAEEE